jgi:hypothetical protein
MSELVREGRCRCRVFGVGVEVGVGVGVETASVVASIKWVFVTGDFSGVGEGSNRETPGEGVAEGIIVGLGEGEAEVEVVESAGGFERRRSSVFDEPLVTQRVKVQYVVGEKLKRNSAGSSGREPAKITTISMSARVRWLMCSQIINRLIPSLSLSAESFSVSRIVFSESK